MFPPDNVTLLIVQRDYRQRDWKGNSEFALTHTRSSVLAAHEETNITISKHFGIYEALKDYLIRRRA